MQEPLNNEAGSQPSNAMTADRDRLTSGASSFAIKLGGQMQLQAQQNPESVVSLFDQAVPGFADSVVSVSPLITSQTPEALADLVERARRMDPEYQPPDFSNWYNVKFQPRATTTSDPEFIRPQEVNEVVARMIRLPEVDSIHPLRAGPPPMAVNPGDDPRSINQGYLDAAPNGIGARYAWTLPGGDGAGIGFVDLEQGWNLNHEDLAAQNITLISGRNAYYFEHGTSVLGQVLMVDNNIGGVGISPRAKGRVISQHRDDWSYNTADAIIDATARMSFGDVLLLEAQEFDPVSGAYYWPVEVSDANYEAIRMATALGITVVEAGCNGAYNLDTYVNAAGKAIFNRSSPDFRDSGAVMVGAASSTLPHYRMYFSNYGSRIDVFAWGENVDTTSTDYTGTDNDEYTSWFNGTSSASPIISGAALILQGIAEKSRGRRLPPRELRALLQIDGTKSQDPGFDRIGVMPNLRAIINAAGLGHGCCQHCREKGCRNRCRKCRENGCSQGEEHCKERCGKD
ncbi:hypothetical protein H2201_005825 [Coniosporium apollinis]|uniref:Peptidase S8/S53 domain-containing protein n=1 Tax=Coniosporium apollinis TaxID=61459 RepID=A0ABQ9NRZ6_9PEZI|nr:hypothetical protein H2201_005825 [Coniosporium apollinis]